jgi:hypothetical protein
MNATNPVRHLLLSWGVGVRLIWRSPIILNSTICTDGYPGMLNTASCSIINIGQSKQKNIHIRQQQRIFWVSIYLEPLLLFVPDPAKSSETRTCVIAYIDWIIQPRPGEVKNIIICQTTPNKIRPTFLRSNIVLYWGNIVLTLVDIIWYRAIHLKKHVTGHT